MSTRSGQDQLVEKLCAELPGILRWLVEGAHLWWVDREAGKDGLAIPDAVRTATSDYRDSMDRVGAFLTDCCVVEPGALANSKTLRAVYERWSGSNGEEALPPQAFGRRLREKGFESVKGTNGQRRWRGLMVRADAAQTSSEGGAEWR